MTRIVILSFLIFRNETETMSKAEFVNVEDIYNEIIAVYDTTCNSWHDVKRIARHLTIVQISDRLASEVLLLFSFSARIITKSR